MTGLIVTCTAFLMGGTIPDDFTCSGANISPPLEWSQGPSGTQSFVVICDDPDASSGDWVHWILFNISADTTSLPEGMPKDAKLPNGAVQGITSFRTPGYGGPCPPSGKPHRYYFRVYALDKMLKISKKSRKNDVMQAMQGHILAQGELMGMFGR